MSFLVFRHVAREHLGWFAQTLDVRRIPYRYLDLTSSPDVPIKLEEAIGLILLGGPMSANDNFPYISRELYLIEKALQQRLPLLGVCLGAQLIAKACGAKVYRNPVPEVGWFPLFPTPAALSDPLFRHFRHGEPIFQWHAETFDLPAGSTWLARSNDCPHQAFSRPHHVYGLQFHIEATPDMIRSWCREDEACGDSREMTGPIDPLLHAPRMQQLAALVFNEWLTPILDKET